MFRIINWSSHQSYKDRRPPWIRFHKTLLDNFEFQSMSVNTRAILPMLWLLASEHEDPTSGIVEQSCKIIAFRLRLSETDVVSAVEEAERSGFITVLQDCNETVTKELQNRSQTVHTETETETETEKRHSNIAPDGVSVDVWKDFITHRKAKKAPVTKTAVAGIRREAEKAGMNLQQALEIMVNRGWTGFKAEWMKDTRNGNNHKNTEQSSGRNGSPAGEQGGNGFGGRKSQTEIAADITQQIIRDRRARWEANGGKNPDQGLLGKPRTTQLAITADVHDVEEIR